MITINKTKALQQFGQALADVRSSKKISIPELAAKTGIEENILEEIEQGARDFEYTTLLKIAKGLNSDLYQLLPIP